MPSKNDQLRALIEEPEHQNQAALLLLYAMTPSEEDLLAIVLHVPFLCKHAAEKLLASIPREETLWQIVSQIPELQEQAERMLFKHYPSRANLVKLLHPTWGVWNAEAAELLLASNPSDDELRAILRETPDEPISPWKDYRQQVAHILST
jgi:hypothetical protein